MNLLSNFDTSFFNLSSLVRIGLLIGAVFYIVFGILVVRQISILTKAVDTEDGGIINSVALILLLAGLVFLAVVAWLVFF